MFPIAEYTHNQQPLVIACRKICTFIRGQCLSISVILRHLSPYYKLAVAWYKLKLNSNLAMSQTLCFLITLNHCQDLVVVLVGFNIASYRYVHNKLVNYYDPKTILLSFQLGFHFHNHMGPGHSNRHAGKIYTTKLQF